MSNNVVNITNEVTQIVEVITSGPKGPIGPIGPAGPSGSGGGDSIFMKNRTTAVTSSIAQYQSIFNPTNLTVASSSIFIVEQDAEYYVLNDVINSGSIEVNGTMIIDGGLINLGSITGTGAIL